MPKVEKRMFLPQKASLPTREEGKIWRDLVKSVVIVTDAPLKLVEACWRMWAVFRCLLLID